MNSKQMMIFLNQLKIMEVYQKIKNIYLVLGLKKELIILSPMMEKLQPEMKKKDLIVQLLEIKKFQQIK